MMTDVNNFQYVREHVREVPDFPKKGILFLDVTTIVKDAKAFNMCIDFLYEKFKDENIDYVAGIESRGFIFGAPLACKLNAGFVTVRKPNKLPADTIKETYDYDGLNVLQNNGEAAGQTVFHLHVHLIPRMKDDNIDIKWAQGECADGEKIAEKIKANLTD